jgi:hypothetical protein
MYEHTWGSCFPCNPALGFAVHELYMAERIQPSTDFLLLVSQMDDLITVW